MIHHKAAIHARSHVGIKFITIILFYISFLYLIEAVITWNEKSFFLVNNIVKKKNQRDNNE